MKTILSALLVLTISIISFGQNYQSDYLDGTIMFKLKNAVSVDHPVFQKDPHDFGLTENLNDYPEIAEILTAVTVTTFERPSYFTRKSELQKIYRITFNEFDKIDDLVKELNSLDIIEFAEKEPIYKIDFIPNDTYHTGNNKWYHTLVGSEAAWDISIGSNSIKVAIVDNAVFTGHADLTTYAQRDVADGDNDPTPPSYSTVDFGWSHGTHCSGLATADINNSTGIASIGGNVELIGVKCTPNSASSGSVWYSYNGVQWACQNGADVVSMSFGGSGYSASFQSLINAYPDVVFLAAAGNDNSTNVQYPGGYNNVICVGSVDATDQRSSFSNYNGSTQYVDIASPGGYSFGGLLSTVYTSGGNGYDQMGGTSMATPFAAGLVGLMLSLNPALTPTQVENCLLSSGVNINQNIGPRIDAYAAMQCVQSTLTGDPIPFFTGVPTSVQEGQTVTFTDNSADGGNPITSWSWSFPGGTPSSFSGQTPPAIQYNTAGVYDVTLTVTNSQSSQSNTQTGYITVTIPPYGDWINQSSGFSQANRGINHISIVDANTVWATAYDGSGGGANVQQFTKTTNGGNTWTPGNINIGNSNLGISMIHALDANTAWLAAYPTGAGQQGGIWKTTNGGTTWTHQTSATYSNSSSFTNVVYFWDANNGFCQGDPINGDFELYTTTNGGTTWTAVPGGNIPNPLNGNEFGYTRQIEVVGDNVWFTTSLGRIYHSADKGYTWTVYTSPISDFGGAVTATSSGNLSFGSATDGIIVDNNANVYTTSNGGSTWSPVTTTGSVFTNGLCYIEGTNTIFTTGAGTGTSGSSYSADGGVNWNIIDTEQHLYVEFTNPSIGWSGWFNQNATTDGMWKWNDLSSNLIADFASSTINSCVGVTVNYTDQTTGATPTSWNWIFDGGTPPTSTAQNPTVTYNTPGTYGVSLTVSDGSSQTTITDTAYITVTGLPAQPGTINGNSQICANSTETYGVVNDPTVVYNWTIPATWTGSSTFSSITVTADATPGTIEVTAENICGVSSPTSLAITILAQPTASFTSVNNNGINDFSFTSTSTDATSWSWDFGDGIGTSNQENPNYVYPNNGTYTVTLIVTNACGTDTYTQVVNVAGVGLGELSSDLMHVFPNPTSDKVTIAVSNELIGNSIELTDLTGHVLSNAVLTQKETTLDMTSLSAGVYFIRIKGETAIQRIIKK